MQKHNIVKIFYNNGTSECGTLISQTEKEITLLNKNKFMKSVQLSHIKTMHNLGFQYTKSRRDSLSKKRVVPKPGVQQKTGVQKANTKKEKSPSTKLLYLMSLGNDFYKIGYTKNISRRLKSFKTCSPFPIELISTKKTLANKVIEKEADLIHTFKEKFKQSEGGQEVFEIKNRKNAVKIFNSV